MSADASIFWRAANSKPLRGSLLIFLLILSYYLSNPFSGIADQKPAVKSEDKEKGSWLTWKAEADNFEMEKHNDTLSETHEAGPRIRQATMIYSTDKYNVIYERAVTSHLKHGDEWGVPTHILRHDIVEAGFFNKPAYILGLIIDEMAKPYGQRADWIVWFDADSILLNRAVPWNLFLPPPEFQHINFLASKDQNGFNAGMFFVRVHEWSVKMLAQVISLREYHPEVELPFDDQSALMWALERNGYQEHTIYQPHNWWNAFGLQGKPFEHDRFVLHFAGVGCCGGEDKPTSMGRWLDRIETEPDHYYRPLSNLSLPAEVSAFWGTATSAQKALDSANEWGDEAPYKTSEIQNARATLKRTLLREADDLSKLKAAVTKLEDLRQKINKESAAQSQKSSDPQGSTKKKDEESGT